MKIASILLACLIMASCQPGGPLSPLITAAREGDTAKLSQLIEAGADPDERGGVNDWTPLMHAVHKKQLASVKALLAAGANPNLTAGAEGRDTALSLAEAEGYAEITIALRDHGAKPSQ
jgi:ankyrin repeat protein